jgi:hypothetical protein
MQKTVRFTPDIIVAVFLLLPVLVVSFLPANTSSVLLAPDGQQARLISSQQKVLFVLEPSGRDHTRVPQCVGG